MLSPSAHLGTIMCRHASCDAYTDVRLARCDLAPEFGQDRSRGVRRGSTAEQVAQTPISTDAAWYLGEAIGRGVGLVVRRCRLGSKTNRALSSLLDHLVEAVPQEGEDLVDSWKRVAEAHTQELVDRKAISSLRGRVILAVFKLVLRGYSLIKLVSPIVLGAVEAVLAFAAGFIRGIANARDAKKISTVAKSVQACSVAHIAYLTIDKSDERKDVDKAKAK